MDGDSIYLSGQIIIIHQPEMLGHFGMIPLTNYDFQWARSEVVIIYPDIYNITGVAFEKLVWHWQELLQSPRDCPNSDPPSYGNL